MLEIIILYKLAKRIGAIVTEKGYRKSGYQAMLVVLWLGGEFFGAFMGVIVGAIVEVDEGQATLLAYGFALGGAIIGAVIAVQIAKHLAPLEGSDAAFNVQGLELDRWGERFKPYDSTSRSPTDTYISSPEPTHPPPDDRIQN
jgi:hypothetical protein